jgi:hypothetical protein
VTHQVLQRFDRGGGATGSGAGYSAAVRKISGPFMNGMGDLCCAEAPQEQGLGEAQMLH